MPQKILVKGPALSRSGYGEQTRFALRALASRQDLYDIYLVNIGWGKTGHLGRRNEEFHWLASLQHKTQEYMNNQGTFDISLQVTIPNEFEKIAPINIGYTAGIETTRVAPEWIQKCNEIVDKVIVVSNHSKKVFENTTYDVKDQNGKEYPGWGIQVPVEVVNYPVREYASEPLNIEFETESNFLCVSQWGPRKNVENTLRWFIEEFKEDETVGLVLKTNSANDTVKDRLYTTMRLEHLLKEHPDRKCKIYFLHGDLTPSQLTWLYQHPTMKALINIGHGEGYGLPLFEAAYNGLPLVTISWSGQMDFICKPNKKGKSYPRVALVDYDLKEVQKEAVWKGIIQEDSKWAYAKKASYQRQLREVLNKETHYRRQAGALQKHVLANFTEEKIYNDFVNCFAPQSTAPDASGEESQVFVL